MPKKIAIVEDEAELAALIEYNLVRHGYEAMLLGGSTDNVVYVQRNHPTP